MTDAAVAGPFSELDFHNHSRISPSCAPCLGPRYDDKGRRLARSLRALGHASPQSTLRYLSADIDDVRQGMEKMADSASQPTKQTAKKA